MPTFEAGLQFQRLISPLSWWEHGSTQTDIVLEKYQYRELYILIHRRQGEHAWTFETSKPTHNDILPPRLYLLISSNSATPWWLPIKHLSLCGTFSFRLPSVVSTVVGCCVFPGFTGVVTAGVWTQAFVHGQTYILPIFLMSFVHSSFPIYWRSVKVTILTNEG